MPDKKTRCNPKYSFSCEVLALQATNFKPTGSASNPVRQLAWTLLLVGLQVTSPALGGEEKKRDSSEKTPQADSNQLNPNIETILVKAGSFNMGSPSVEFERRKNEVQHKVTLTRNFTLVGTR